MQRIANKRYAKKKHIAGGRKNKGIVRKPYAGQVKHLGEVGVEDCLVQPFVYRELPTLRFNTAAQVGAIYYYANSMYEMLVGTTAAIPFWAAITRNYERYLVLHSRIVVNVQNRETVNSIAICVFPCTVNTAIASGANFTSLQSLPGAKTYILQGATGGMSTHTFRLGISLPRIVGEQYEEQDQWAGVSSTAGAGTPTNPTAFVYWGIAYYNPSGNNTLTTGGITCQVSITNKVRLNKPVRGINSDGLLAEFRLPITSSTANQVPSDQDTVDALAEWLGAHNLQISSAARPRITM